MDINTLERGLITGKEVAKFPNWGKLSSFLTNVETRKCNGEDINSVGAYVIITPESFSVSYSVDSRTYLFSSSNKAFQTVMGGYSIFASSVDGTDRGVRIEGYLRDERGGDKGWEIQECGIFL